MRSRLPISGFVYQMTDTLALRIVTTHKDYVLAVAVQVKPGEDVSRAMLTHLLQWRYDRFLTVAEDYRKHDKPVMYYGLPACVPDIYADLPGLVRHLRPPNSFLRKLGKYRS